MAASVGCVPLSMLMFFFNISIETLNLLIDTIMQSSMDLRINQNTLFRLGIIIYYIVQ